MSDGSRVGVVTIAHRRPDHLAAQQRSLAAGTRRPERYLVVAMDDDAITEHVHDGLRREVVHVPLTASRLPLAAARNHGVARLAGDVDVLVLLDVDCLAGPGLVAGYAEAVLDTASVVWSGPVTYLPPASTGGYDLASLAERDDPHPGRPAPAPGERIRGAAPELFWSLSFALTPATWQRVGGFCERYTGYGAEDTDFAMAADQAGVELGWVGSARAYHQHHPVSTPPVEHLDDILRNGRIYRGRWGEWPMVGWLRELARRGLVREAGDDWVAIAPGASDRGGDGAGPGLRPQQGWPT